MQKHNLLAKKLKKQFLSINDSLEHYFNNLKKVNLKTIKAKFYKDSKLFWGVSIFVILTISYFLAPTAYDKPTTKQIIKNQILNKYNINIKFNEKVTYALLPKPHFKTKNLSIIENNKTIANISNFRVYIAIDKLISLKGFETKDILFNKTEFFLYKNDLNFFFNLLKIEPSKNKIVIKNSKLFFNDNNDEVLFINKISNGKIYYDSKNYQNILTAKNEVFNIPFKVKIKNDKFNKKLISEFNSKKIRLNIENELDYTNKLKKGIMEILLINKSTEISYEINNNSLIFSSNKTKNNYEGKIDFRPFYFTTKFNYDRLSLKNLFKDESILIDLIKNELLSNKNLNMNLSVKVRDITNIDELNNLFLSMNIQEGIINLSNSNIMWKDDLKISLSESLLIYDQNQINLVGKFIFDFENIDNFYKSFQIKRSARKKIKQIQTDFNYNFDTNRISFDNIRIDNSPNLEIQKFIDDFNSNQNKFLNKVVFKNFVNSFFNFYAG